MAHVIWKSFSFHFIQIKKIFFAVLINSKLGVYWGKSVNGILARIGPDR